ncbi:hypothetical protein PYCCODRAFT_1432650 [Trametes coccinea BRFM310]|uniref:Uncharacterized protein n=1 Tax=Trametes coccinea (strain BRFM310) TaxID=1353009 RepID=A0A1Y2IWH2_TRAC3|nr:hypothetical protein PYCCODRAFT_1432650 [Trametes coccinea BRFM310]
MPTWELSYLSSPSSAKPALAHTISKRRGQQLRSACQELASAESPTLRDDHALRLRGGDPDERSRIRSGLQNGEKGTTPRAFTQRTVRRKKSSFDLRDLFLSGEMGSSVSSSRTPSDA